MKFKIEFTKTESDILKGYYEKHDADSPLEGETVTISERAGEAILKYEKSRYTVEANSDERFVVELFEFMIDVSDKLVPLFETLEKFVPVFQQIKKSAIGIYKKWNGSQIPIGDEMLIKEGFIYRLTLSDGKFAIAKEDDIFDILSDNSDGIESITSMVSQEDVTGEILSSYVKHINKPEVIDAKKSNVIKKVFNV